MKNVTVILVLLITCLTGCNRGAIDIGNDSYIRPTQMAVMDGFQSGSLLGTLNSGEYFSVSIRPGVHRFTSMFNDSGSLKGNGITTAPINLEAGKTYYFQIIQKPASHIQDILIEQRNNFNAISSYKPSQPLPTSEPTMSLVYFYYDISSSLNKAKAEETERMKQLQKKLGCSDQQIKNGTCQ